MVLSDVEETVTIVEVDEENEDEAVRVRSLCCESMLVFDSIFHIQFGQV